MNVIALTVNGRRVATAVEPRQHLGDFVREELLLTGTHLGCEHGVCGACTVLIDGAPARSCISFPAALDGSSVTTIEGLADDEVMVRLREAFSAEHGLQCGFCTPGMLIMARDIVLRRPGADAAIIRHELAGNLCRCTGYVGIVRAIQRVADERRGLAPVITRARAVEAPGAASPLTLPQSPSRAGLAGAAVPQGAAAAAPAAAGFAGPLRNPVTIEERFGVPATRDAVWALIIDPARVVACLPGARLVAPSDGRTVEAEMVVKLGPMQAAFGGVGVLTADPATWSGSIEGTGADRRSATRVQAHLAFRLDEEADGHTAITVHVAYALQGPLAQMSRGAIARDLAGRMTQIFAANLSAMLASGVSSPPESKPLTAGSLAMVLIRGWLRRWRLRP